MIRKWIPSKPRGMSASLLVYSLLLLIVMSGCDRGGSVRGDCIEGGDQTTINVALQEDGDDAELCPGAVFEIDDSVRFSADNQAIFTSGFPSGGSRAILQIASDAVVTAVDGLNRSGVRLSHVIVDGRRPEFGYVDDGGALIQMGGNATGQVVEEVKAFDPREWTILHVFEGSRRACRGAVVASNVFGPAGHPNGTWADGISFACRDGHVFNNEIFDATDAGIALFGAPRSLISNNIIRAESRIMLAGIAMVDFNPFGGDYRGTRVTDNRIEAPTAPVIAAIPMGPRVWACPSSRWPAGPLRGAVVSGNELSGEFMGYGFVADGVEDWTVIDNVSTAQHGGEVERGGCGQLPSLPAAFLMHEQHASGTFQPEFEQGHVENLTRLIPTGYRSALDRSLALEVH